MRNAGLNAVLLPLVEFVIVLIIMVSGIKSKSGKSCLRIQSYDVKPLRAELKKTFGVSGGEHKTLDNILVVIKLENGMAGQGEAAIAPHMTGETPADSMAALKTIGPLLAGIPLEDVFPFLIRMRECYPKNPSAVAAVEMAVFDGMAQSRRVPLWRIFGSNYSAIATDMTVVIGTVKDAGLWASQWYQKGFRTFKIKVGRDKELDIPRVQAVCRAAPRSRILLDANQAFTPEGMVKLIRALRSKRIEVDLIEQPVPRLNHEGLREVWKKTGVPVLADESASSLEDCRSLIRKKQVPAINFKIMKFGMIQGRMFHQMARNAGIQIMVGQMMETVLGSLAAAHLAVGLGGISWLDLDAPFYIKGRFGKSGYLKRQGIYQISRTRPGVGVSLK